MDFDRWMDWKVLAGRVRFQVSALVTMAVGVAAF
jgi:hypothetical protein